MSDVDPLDQLEILAEMQDDDVGVPDELRRAVLDVASESRPKRSRLRLVAAISVSAAVVVGGSVGIAALLRRQPERPEQGPACRGGPSLDSPLYALGPGADPIADCAELWRSGYFPIGGEGDGSVPPLVACIGPNGAVEVFPGPPDFCTALGLDDAALELDEQGAAIETLSTRITEEINLADCAPTEVVRGHVERILRELHLEGWSVVPNEDAVDAPCVRAQVDSSTKVIHLFRF